MQDKNLLNSDTRTLHEIDISKATVSDKYLTALNAYTAKTWDQSQHRATQVTFNFSRISLCSVMTQPLVTHCSVYLCTCVSSVSVLPLLHCLDDGWVVWQYLHKNICRQSYGRLSSNWIENVHFKEEIMFLFQYGPYSRTTSLLLLSLVWIWIFMTFFMFLFLYFVQILLMANLGSSTEVNCVLFVVILLLHVIWVDYITIIFPWKSPWPWCQV